MLRGYAHEAQRARRVLRHGVWQDARGGEDGEPEGGTGHVQRRIVHLAHLPARGPAPERRGEVAQVVHSVDMVGMVVRDQQVNRTLDPARNKCICRSRLRTLFLTGPTRGATQAQAVLTGRTGVASGAHCSCRSSRNSCDSTSSDASASCSGRGGPAGACCSSSCLRAQGPGVGSTVHCVAITQCSRTVDAK